MTPICPKCGRQVIYIAFSRENKVYVVDAEEKRLITKMGRVSSGYQEHICTRWDKTVEGADVKKDAETCTG